MHVFRGTHSVQAHGHLMTHAGRHKRLEKLSSGQIVDDKKQEHGLKSVMQEAGVLSCVQGEVQGSE